MRGGKNFRRMFSGCAGLRADLSGWRLGGGGGGGGIELRHMLANSGAAAVGSLEAWVAERRQGAAGVDVHCMLLHNTGTQRPSWASEAKNGDKIR